MSLAQLHDLLPEPVILVIDHRFYGDESGTHDEHGDQRGSEVASVAGCVGTKDEWKTWERRWNTALRKFSVREFHTSEFFSEHPPPDWPYLGWSENKRRRFLLLLIKIIRDRHLCLYASMVETKTWDTTLDSETKLPVRTRRRKTVRNPYLICFNKFFAKFPAYFEEVIRPRFGTREPIEPVAFVFHNHQVFSSWALRSFNATHGHPTIDPHKVVGTLVFGPTRCYPPLQAADLVAYYSRRKFWHHLNGTRADEFESALLDVDPEDPDEVYLTYLSRENLLDLQRNSERLREARKND